MNVVRLVFTVNSPPPPPPLQLSALDERCSQLERFGEAEMFMHHVAKVERYELRLECMAFLGNFDELLNSTQPVCVCVCV